MGLVVVVGGSDGWDERTEGGLRKLNASVILPSAVKGPKS